MYSNSNSTEYLLRKYNRDTRVKDTLRRKSSSSSATCVVCVVRISSRARSKTRKERENSVLFAWFLTSRLAVFSLLVHGQSGDTYSKKI